ncbi:hypothetical protein HYW73_01145 [Candidatus Nomurabacteria bacterium]|nr:hypothetical protein [Candidatus Nomurabacteria bacterium]
METKIFTLNEVQNLDKLSCHNYDPELLALIKKLTTNQEVVSLKKLSEKITYGSGKWELRTTDYVPESYPDRVKLLQISNIDDNGQIIETERDKYISSDLHAKWAVSKVRKGDLVIAITGTLGRIALFDKNYEANLNQALGIIRLKKEFNGVKILPEFVHLYLNSYYAVEQFMGLGGYRAGQSGLSLDEIGSIYIVLPEEKKQIEILEKVKKIRDEASEQNNQFKKSLQDISNTVDNYINFDLSQVSKTWITGNEEIIDRIDCYFHSQQLKLIHKKIKELDKKDFDIIKAGDLNLIKAVSKKWVDKNKFHIFKYIDIGNTEKELGDIKGFEEDILLNLPSRSRMFTLTDDLLLPRPIGSTQGIIKIKKEFDKQFFSTGNIQIRPNSSDEAFLLWAILKSNTVQNQLFYLQSGSSQPDITPENFKKYVLIPIPKGEIKEKIIKDIKSIYGMAREYKSNVKSKESEVYKTFVKEIDKELK